MSENGQMKVCRFNIQATTIGAARPQQEAEELRLFWRKYAPERFFGEMSQHRQRILVLVTPDAGAAIVLRSGHIFFSPISRSFGQTYLRKGMALVEFCPINNRSQVDYMMTSANKQPRQNRCWSSFKPVRSHPSSA